MTNERCIHYKLSAHLHVIRVNTQLTKIKHTPTPSFVNANTNTAIKKKLKSAF